MPFGLTNAPATFQRMMDIILRDLKDFALVYMDDIIVFSHSFDAHMHHLRQVFDRLRHAQLVLKPKKCKLFRAEVEFLGHIISHNSVMPDPARVSAILDYPTPTTIKQLQTFLGFVGYYRRFVPHLADKAAPLYSLLKKGKQWRWRETVEQRAIVELKQALTSPPLLRPPDSSLPFLLHTDASDTGLGAVLSQLPAPQSDTTATTTSYIEHPI